MTKSITFRAFLLVAALIATSVTVQPTNAGPADDKPAEQRAIQQLLDTYGAALNGSDAARIIPLFAQDGVFLAPGNPTATGQNQIKGAFDGLFGAVTLKLQFTPAQITVVNDKYAYATSTSSGTLTVKSNGQSAPNAYRELWVFVKENGQWKIARYLFNQPN
ncbi:YybH family protein [Spirosoma arcticum]